jgi:hypothetical protein
VSAGQHFTVSWTSGHSNDCEAAGAPADVPWQGTQTSSGSRDFASAMVGDFTFTISCRGLWGAMPAAVAQAAITVQPPPVLAVSLTANSTSVAVGESFTLTWSSQNVTSCWGSGGGASGAPWSGALPTDGSASQAATTTGTFTYLIACEVGADTVEAQSTVTVVSPPASSGGGGPLDLTLLAAVAAYLRGVLARRGVRTDR